MKKEFILIAGLLIIMSQFVWAQDTILIQGTYMNVGRGTTTEYPEGSNTEMSVTDTSFATAGVSVTGYWGSSFGILAGLGLTSSTAAQGLSLLPGIAPFSTSKTTTTTKTGDKTDTEESISGGSFNGVSLAGDLGVGLRIGEDKTAFILGAGTHVNSIAMPEYSSWMLGIGTQAIALVPIADALSVAASVRLAYSFLEFGRIPELDMDDDDDVETTANGAFSWSVSFGVGLPIGS